MSQLEAARRRVVEAWEEAEAKLEDWGAAREELEQAEAELARLERLESAS